LPTLVDRIREMAVRRAGKGPKQPAPNALTICRPCTAKIFFACQVAKC
jgi:hypothetical protein